MCSGLCVVVLGTFCCLLIDLFNWEGVEVLGSHACFSFLIDQLVNFFQMLVESVLFFPFSETQELLLMMFLQCAGMTFLRWWSPCPISRWGCFQRLVERAFGNIELHAVKPTVSPVCRRMPKWSGEQRSWDVRAEDDGLSGNHLLQAIEPVMWTSLLSRYRMRT